MIKRILGVLLLLAGLAFFGYMFFMAFNGKYGMNQFMNDLAHFRGNMSALGISAVGLAAAVLGGVLAFTGKKKK